MQETDKEEEGEMEQFREWAVETQRPSVCPWASHLGLLSLDFITCQVG